MGKPPTYIEFDVSSPSVSTPDSLGMSMGRRQTAVIVKKKGSYADMVSDRVTESENYTMNFEEEDCTVRSFDQSAPRERENAIKIARINSRDTDKTEFKKTAESTIKEIEGVKISVNFEEESKGDIDEDRDEVEDADFIVVADPGQ
jgi:hypothetical protein